MLFNITNDNWSCLFNLLTVFLFNDFIALTHFHSIQCSKWLPINCDFHSSVESRILKASQATYHTHITKAYSISKFWAKQQDNYSCLQYWAVQPDNSGTAIFVVFFAVGNCIFHVVHVLLLLDTKSSDNLYCNLYALFIIHQLSIFCLVGRMLQFLMCLVMWSFVCHLTHSMAENTVSDSASANVAAGRRPIGKEAETLFVTNTLKVSILYELHAQRVNCPILVDIVHKTVIKLCTYSVYMSQCNYEKFKLGIHEMLTFNTQNHFINFLWNMQWMEASRHCLV